MAMTSVEGGTSRPPVDEPNRRPADLVEPAEPAALLAASCLFRCLADPSRLAILGHLALGEHRVRDLTEHLGLAQSTVSAHLRCMLDCGLVTCRPEGRASHYSLAARPEVLELLGAAERLLAVTGDAVVICPRYGADRAEPAPASTDPPAPNLRVGTSR